MKYFERRNLKAARAFARFGGEALWENTCTKVLGAFRESKRTAKLFDLDLVRLTDTAQRLGIVDPQIDQVGTEGQHVDLGEDPFELALEECK